jgi:hypothetical protein
LPSFINLPSIDPLAAPPGPLPCALAFLIPYNTLNAVETTIALAFTATIVIFAGV